MTKRVLLASAILGLLVVGTFSPIFATVDLNAYLPIGGTPITPQFVFTKNVAIDYSGGGKLKDLMNGKNMTISFTDTSSNNTSIKAFMESINTEFAIDRKTTATLSNLTVNYQVQINGDDKGATIDYKIALTPLLNGYVLNKGGGDVPTVFDISWMGFKMTGPIIIAAPGIGNLDINSPMGIIRSPSGPTATTDAPSASIVAGWSLAGSAWAILPPTVAQFRTTGSAMTLEVSERIG